MTNRDPPKMKLRNSKFQQKKYKDQNAGPAKCGNCSRRGHSTAQCYREGGGRWEEPHVYKRRQEEANGKRKDQDRKSRRRQQQERAQQARERGRMGEVSSGPSPERRSRSAHRPRSRRSSSHRSKRTKRPHSSSGSDTEEFNFTATEGKEFCCQLAEPAQTKKTPKYIDLHVDSACSSHMLPASQQADWWAIGGVGCSNWTGVLLRDVLVDAKVEPSAVYVAYIGEDEGGLSRGIPIQKALDGHTMLAWEMNGVALPAYHGFPLRLLAPGFPGSAQGKWLKVGALACDCGGGPHLTIPPQ